MKTGKENNTQTCDCYDDPHEDMEIKNKRSIYCRRMAFWFSVSVGAGSVIAFIVGYMIDPGILRIGWLILTGTLVVLSGISIYLLAIRMDYFVPDMCNSSIFNIMKNKIIYVLIMILVISYSGCMEDEALNLNYEGFTPEYRDDGWEITIPEKENMDINSIENVYRDFFDESKYPNIRSLLIVRNGKLVAESYCKNENERDRYHNTMSVTKSITSILVGMALDQGLIESIETPVYRYLHNYFDRDVRKQEISIRQTLTMETGLDFDNNVHASELISCKESSLEYILHKDLIFEPGTDWYYGNGNSHLLAGIIQVVSGKSLSEYAYDNLFKPLGIHNFQWENLYDGTTYGAQGLWLMPRDMAKIGLLMANGGIWNGESIVSEEWVKASTHNQSTHHNYGYTWLPVEDKAFYAEGHGGQLIWAYPEKNLVIVITSDPYAKTWKLSAGYTGLFEGIIQSLND